MSVDCTAFHEKHQQSGPSSMELISFLPNNAWVNILLLLVRYVCDKRWIHSLSSEHIHSFGAHILHLADQLTFDKYGLNIKSENDSYRNVSTRLLSIISNEGDNIINGLTRACIEMFAQIERVVEKGRFQKQCTVSTIVDEEPTTTSRYVIFLDPKALPLSEVPDSYRLHSLISIESYCKAQQLVFLLDVPKEYHIISSTDKYQHEKKSNMKNESIAALKSHVPVWVLETKKENITKPVDRSCLCFGSSR